MEGLARGRWCHAGQASWQLDFFGSFKLARSVGGGWAGGEGLLEGLAVTLSEQCPSLVEGYRFVSIGEMVQ